MTKNYIFRSITCGLSIEKTAKLCCISLTKVKKWDKGKTIPNGYKRLMKLYSGRKLSHLPEWEGFKFTHDCLELPTGHRLKPQQILAGIALVEIECLDDLKTLQKLLTFARVIAKIQTVK